MGSALGPWEEFRLRFTAKIMLRIEFRCQEATQNLFSRYRKVVKCWQGPMCGPATSWL
jgi:hypothetical protein